MDASSDSSYKILKAKPFLARPNTALGFPCGDLEISFDGYI
jgi:hypothetical protein